MLEKDDSFQQLVPGPKRLLDTIKMIVYRAESEITGLLTGPVVDTRLPDDYSRICSLPRLIFSLMPTIRFYGSRSMVLPGQRPTDLASHFLKSLMNL